MDRLDRKLGALLGLAIGDAVGTTLEFCDRDRQPALTDMVGGGPFSLKPGEWTDDTAMAVALAESLLAKSAFDAADCMARFLNWYRWGYGSCTGTCFDIGFTTKAALQRFEANGNPFAGDPHPGSAGNGSIMRLAPVAIAFADNVVQAMAVAAEQSRLTHAAEEAIEGSRALAYLLVSAFSAETKDIMFERAMVWQGVSSIEAILRGSWRQKSREDIESSGYVVHTLEAACWCVWQTNTFQEAILLAANLADDADTVAAVTGQIAGALYGLSGLPEGWLTRLAWAEKLEQLAVGLAELDPRLPPA